MRNKLLISSIIIILSLFSNTSLLKSQETVSSETQKPKTSLVIKNDGSRFLGVIISRDEREILIETENIGRLYIPLHEIAEIRETSDSSTASLTNLFSTRYFLTTNGLSMSKGEKYAMLNYYGPEAEFALADNFTMGVMTTWVAMPLIGSAKYTIHFSDNAHLALGTLFGTLSWVKLDAAGFLGYGAFTIGNYENNFTVSAGYAGITADGDSGGAPLMSLAFLIRLGDNVKLVGDSFIYLGEEKFSILVPGLRFSRPMKRSSFQMGLGAIVAGGEAIPLPVPIFSWFYEL